MAINFCLSADAASKFKSGLLSGDINPEKLANMTSEERRNFFSKYVGDLAAPQVNAEFESKLLLKNQKQGMITWARGVAGLSQPARRDLITRIEKLDKVLNPADKEMFLADLAEKKLGVGVTTDEAQTIADLSKKVTDAKAKQLDNGTFPTEDDRLMYGLAVTDLSEYVNNLKSKSMGIQWRTLGRDILTRPGAVFSKIIELTLGNAKSINSALDNSSIFRQGWKSLWAEPNIWRKNAIQTFVDIAKQLGGQDVLKAVNAEIVSRPNFERMKTAELTVGNIEEAFPASLAEKIPVLGRLYKASEAAYTGFVHRTRADVFDKYIRIAQEAGVNIDDPRELRAIGRVVNSLTGRGSIGKLEPVGNVLNNVFFSPRFMASNIQTFTQPLTAGTPFARKMAAKNLVKVISGTAAVLATANALMPGSVEWDPRSADFGKIRIGNTRYDVTGGLGSYVVLAARLATNQSKSTATGVITDLGTTQVGAGARTRQDVVIDFFTNKFSPAAGLVRDLSKGKDFNGNEITIGSAIYQLYTPMGVKTYNDLVSDPSTSNVALSMIAEGLGISTSTYMPKGGGGVPSWTKSTSVQIKEFKNAVGDEKFKEAATRYDIAYNAWVNGVKANPEWKKLSSNEQNSLITKQQNQLQKDIFNMYGFKYTAPAKTETQSSLLKSLNQL